MSARAALIGLLIGALVLTACDSASPTVRPSPSLVEVDFSLRPSRTPTRSGTGAEPTDTPAPSSATPPVGWDNAFCNAFGFTVVAQELVIDIERALEEENLRDARGLARDLRDTTASATLVLTDLPAWPPAADATEELSQLIAVGASAAEEYATYFTDGTRSALRRARDLRREIQQRTSGANETFAGLSESGIDCGDLALQLEEF